MQDPRLLQELEELRHLCPFDAAKALPHLERQFKGGTAQMTQQDEQVIRVDQGSLGRTAE
jgi:hypothetical protein